MTSLLLGIVCFMSQTTAGVKTVRMHRASGAGHMSPSQSTHSTAYLDHHLMLVRHSLDPQSAAAKRDVDQFGHF